MRHGLSLYPDYFYYLVIIATSKIFFTQIQPEGQLDKKGAGCNLEFLI